MFSQIRRQEDLTLENGQITYTTDLGATSLDLATVMKATQAISDEIVLDKLLDKLMNSLIENAGARTGLLLLKHSCQWVLVAEGFADRENVIVCVSPNLGDAHLSQEKTLSTLHISTLDTFSSNTGLGMEPEVEAAYAAVGRRDQLKEIDKAITEIEAILDRVLPSEARAVSAISGYAAARCCQNMISRCSDFMHTDLEEGSADHML